MKRANPLIPVCKVPANTVLVRSNLEDAYGKHYDLPIGIDSNGHVPVLDIYDLDLTHVDMEPIYLRLYPLVFNQPESNAEAIFQFALAGFRLGNIYREMYRLYKHYVLGESDLDDALAAFQWYEANSSRIDVPGGDLFAIANEYLTKFDEVGERVVREFAEEHSDELSAQLIKPIYGLLDFYQQFKIPAYVMSANPGKLIRAICKYYGFAKYFIDCVTDTEVPGHKYLKLSSAINSLCLERNLPRIDVIRFFGDSFSGDVSAPYFWKKKIFEQTMAGCPPKLESFFIAHSDKNVVEALRLIGSNEELREMAGSNEIDIYAILLQLLPEGASTDYLVGENTWHKAVFPFNIS